MTAFAHRLAFPFGGGMPVVQSPWGSDLLVTAQRSRLRAALAALTLRSAALVTGNSRGLREQSVRLAPRTPWHRFVWGPHRSVVEAPRRSERLALSTRRLEPNMRVDLVVAAFRRACTQAPETLHGWELIVTHDGSASGTVHAAAEGDPAVRFVGVLKYAELHRLLLRSAMIISVPVSDATSAALMDGLAAGLIPVVNALPGNLEWVDAEIGEVVSRDPSVDELAVAIVRAAQRSPDAGRIRDRVRDIVWEDEVPRLIEAYEQLAGSLGTGG